MARAEESRGELLALQKDAEAASLSIRAADRRRIPGAGGAWPARSGRTSAAATSAASSACRPRCRSSIPGVPSGRRPRPAPTRPQAQREAFRLVLRADIEAARSAAVERRRAAEAYRAAASKNAGEIERIAQVSYDAGERGILELLDAFRTSASARLRQSALDAAARDAEIELEFVSGWEIR